MTAQTPDEAAARKAVVDATAASIQERTDPLALAAEVVRLRAERDSLRARLAAQQPVIDAAGELRTYWRDWPEERRQGVKALSQYVHATAERVTAEYDAYRAASGSVEAADTPPSGTSGHEADTPAEPDAERCDVYVRNRNVMRGGLRTEEIADGVMVDWWTDHHGMEHVAGVEVLNARGVEIDGVDIEKGRPHGTGPEWEVAGTPAAEPAPDGIDQAAALLYNEHGGRIDSTGDWHQPPWDDLGDLVRDEWRTQVRTILALAGAGAPTEPADDELITLRRAHTNLGKLYVKVTDRAHEASTWCGHPTMHRAVRYILTGEVDD